MLGHVPGFLAEEPSAVFLSDALRTDRQSHTVGGPDLQVEQVYLAMGGGFHGVNAAKCSQYPIFKTNYNVPSPHCPVTHNHSILISYSAMQPLDDTLEPSVYLLSCNTGSPPPLPAFSPTFESSPPTVQTNTRLLALKGPITAIEELWRTSIRGFLNDTEFVDIHRKRNTLNTHSLRYGQTVVDY